MQGNIYDKENMLAVIKALPEQIRDAYGMDQKLSLKGKPKNIVVCGMGGSSVAGLLLEAYLSGLGITIPVITIQDYDIPPHIGRDSLVFINSYSGNTEETISCYREAHKRSLNIIVITTGGKLKEYADSNKLPCIMLPKGLQPRNAIAYLFFPLIRVLENAGIIGPQQAIVASLIKALKQGSEQYEKAAQELAQKLHGRLPVIYSSNAFHSVAYRWKCEFNENSKIPAFCSIYPELNHNELNGYMNYESLNIPIHIITLKDEADHRRIVKRMELTKRLIKDATHDKVTFTEIAVKDDELLTRMFTTIYLGDLASYYLALSYATDPTPVEIIERFKKEMGPYIQ